MRKKPPGILLPSAHQVEREYRIIKALASTDVPVPRAHLLCEDAGIIGTAFFVMDFVEGRVMRDPDDARFGDERAACYDSLNDVLARLHKVDFRAVGLGDYGRPQGYVARQSRWSKQFEASKIDDSRDGSPHRMAQAKYSSRRRDHDRTRRLPHREYRLSSGRAARSRGAGLGTFDAGASDWRPGVDLLRLSSLPARP